MKVDEQHRPHGPAPTVWEADILKIRAFEMVLVLFYMETLRRFILQSIQFTDEIFGKDRINNKDPKAKEGKKMNLARELLVSEGVITQAESDELYELLDYRNLIGHKVHELTADVGAYADLVHRDQKILKQIPSYDYTAARRAKALKNKVERGMMNSFVMPLGSESLQFDSAERAYLAEIERLKVRVNRNIAKANKSIAQTNKIIKAIPKSVMQDADPYHPRNTRDNGSLTRAGGECAFKLFEARATPLAVAYMMRISLRSANLWFKKWRAHES